METNISEFLIDVTHVKARNIFAALERILSPERCREGVGGRVSNSLCSGEESNACEQKARLPRVRNADAWSSIRRCCNATARME